VASESDADDLWTLQFPWHASHGVNRISSANSDAQHAHASSIWCVRVCADDQATRASKGQQLWPLASSKVKSRNSQSVVLQDDCVNNARAWLPEPNAVFLRGTAEEMVDLHNSVRGSLCITIRHTQNSLLRNHSLH
jgi:hypothetical protein